MRVDVRTRHACLQPFSVGSSNANSVRRRLAAALRRFAGLSVSSVFSSGAANCRSTKRGQCCCNSGGCRGGDLYCVASSGHMAASPNRRSATTWTRIVVLEVMKYFCGAPHAPPCSTADSLVADGAPTGFGFIGRYRSRDVASPLVFSFNAVCSIGGIRSSLRCGARRTTRMRMFSTTVAPLLLTIYCEKVSS